MTTSHIGNMVKQMMSGLAVAVIALMSVLPAQADRTTTFYHTDHLGSVVAISNEAGEVIQRTDFHDYGSAQRKMSVSGERENQRLGYTGKYFDEHTNTVYLGARFYDPDLGRFLTPDPVGFNEKNLFLFNRYAYGNNNPYLYSDPDGNQPAEFYGAEPVRSQYAGGRLVSDYCYSCAHYRAPTPEETRDFQISSMQAGIAGIGSFSVCIGTGGITCGVALFAGGRDIGKVLFDIDVAFVTAEVVNDSFDLGYSKKEMAQTIYSIDNASVLFQGIRSITKINDYDSDLDDVLVEGATMIGLPMFSITSIKDQLNGDDAND